MPGRHFQGPRYRLRKPPPGQDPAPGNDAIEWIADRHPLFRRGPQQCPNITQIALAARTTPATLHRVIGGELPLSSELMAGMVKASGVDVRSERARKGAELQLFEYIDEDDLAVAA